MDYPRNWHELLKWFPDEGSCLRYLERLRWGAGFACRFCGTAGGDWWQMADGLRRCAGLSLGDLGHGGHDLRRHTDAARERFAAIWYVVNQKQGVSALGLQRMLGFGSYQTAWAWLHKLRRAMVIPGRELLAVAVEVDESYFGARRPGAAGRGVTGKPIVAIAVEDRGEASGRVRMRGIADVTKATLTDFVSTTSPAVPRCAPMAGRATSTSGATPLRTWSRTCRPQATRPRGHAARPPRRFAGPALAPRHSPGRDQPRPARYYLDEFTFRFNRRRSRHRGLPFYRLLEGAVAADPHPTKPSPANPPLEQARSQIGGEKRIAHSRERAAPADRLRVAIDGAHRPGRRVPAGRRWARRHEGLSGLPS